MSSGKARVECEKGWERLYAPVLSKIEELGGKVEQVKEKFGGLRIYFDIEDDTLYDVLLEMTDKAERESFLVCEFCGESGRMQSLGSWIKTMCDKCYGERRREE